MSLEIIIGGMFSGKTSEMIRRLKRREVFHEMENKLLLKHLVAGSKQSMSLCS